MSATAAVVVMEPIIMALGAMLAANLHQRMQLRRLQRAKNELDRDLIIEEMLHANMETHKKAMAELDADIADG